MTTQDHSACERADLVRDYAFEELAPADQKSMKRHFTQCSDCAAELDRLRLTTAALRVLPDVEPPRRIAFVSDQAVKTNWWAFFGNSSARLGFAAACVLAFGLCFTALHHPGETRTLVQDTSMSQADLNAAVNRAVAVAVDKTHADDLRLTKAALDAVDSKYAEKQRNLMVQMGSSLDFLQKRYQMTTRASYSDGPIGVSQ